MNALLQIAGQDAPPTGGQVREDPVTGDAPPTGRERMRYYEQRDRNQNRKLNAPRYEQTDTSAYLSLGGWLTW